MSEDSSKNIVDNFLLIEERLAKSLETVSLDSNVKYVYNPISYALDTHRHFLNQYLDGKKQVLFLGMNPGPWGMSQTGIPFGAIGPVKEWLKVEGTVQKPEREHPKRPVDGLLCKRREISGERLWTLMQDISITPENFFRHCLIYNHCPLAYMGATGKNITPVEMKAAKRNEILKICDEALAEVLELLDIKVVIGIGRYAEQARQAKSVIAAKELTGISVEFLAHPSPASASSNKKGWSELAREQLEAMDGIMTLLTG